MWDIVQTRGKDKKKHSEGYVDAGAHAGAGYHKENHLEGGKEESKPPASCREGTS
jgi:hypothetical protein